ncbi:MAG TPA: carboxypeptidase regulatory-like domain-containing protein, partial [Sulfurimonas sp.]|nr:carboxypeptidase regulatory-like domain-containing protein [Sulfurimonas sp.]
MGYNLSDVMDPVIYNREITSVSKDAEGASAWFAPNISLNSMTFTFYSKGDNYTPSYHFYALSCTGSIATNSISGTIYDESLATGLSNSAVHLYEGSTLKDTQTTDASGLYTFNVVDGNYSIVVDSKTLGNYPTIWAEQIVAPKGGLCSDGAGGTQTALVAAGGCYGGKLGSISDDALTLSSAEHIAEVEVNGADVSDMNFGFSFNGV